MKNAISVVFGILYILLVGCKMDLSREYKAKMACIKIDETSYFAKLKIDSVGSSDALLVHLLNNPYDFSVQTKMIFYINGIPFYQGSFKTHFPITVNLNNMELAHCRVEIIESGCLYVLEDKSVFNWDCNFKVIYTAFFPDNSTTDNIHFFPHQQLVIQ